MKNLLPCGSFVTLPKSSIFSVSAPRDARHQATENKASFWGRTFHGCLIKDFDAENRYEERNGSSRNFSSHVFSFVHFAAKYQVSYPLQQPTTTTITTITVEFSKTFNIWPRLRPQTVFNCCSTMSRRIKWEQGQNLCMPSWVLEQTWAKSKPGNTKRCILRLTCVAKKLPVLSVIRMVLKHHGTHVICCFSTFRFHSRLLPFLFRPFFHTF